MNDFHKRLVYESVDVLTEIRDQLHNVGAAPKDIDNVVRLYCAKLIQHAIMEGPVS